LGSSIGTELKDVFRKFSGLIGIIESGLDGSNSPPRAEISGALSARSLACSSAFLAKRMLLNFFGAFAASMAFLRRFPRFFGGSLAWKTFLIAIFPPPRVATLPLAAFDAPLVPGSPRETVTGSELA
jgi:hypothetical protein